VHFLQTLIYVLEAFLHKLNSLCGLALKEINVPLCGIDLHAFTFDQLPHRVTMDGRASGTGQ